VLKQMMIMTDGCSNRGTNPAAAAARAFHEGVTVNTIGILDDGHLGESGAREVADIAAAGGGMSRVVQVRQLSQTMQMMTRRTVASTIRTVVNRQLQDVFGQPDAEQLRPADKAKVVAVMEDLEEQSPLRLALLIDSSLSMKNKLPAVEEAVRDLLLYLQARRGRSELSVFRFPDMSGRAGASCLLDWTDHAPHAGKLLLNLQVQGDTPTGLAILHVLDYMSANGDMPRGMWSDYVV
jgi:Ca-activated chloride channel family protein